MASEAHLSRTGLKQNPPPTRQEPNAPVDVGPKPEQPFDLFEVPEDLVFL